MKPEFTQPTDGWGLLANGSSGRWDIAVDEALDRDEWSLEINGPEVYLVFLLRDLRVIPQALSFLQSGSRPNPADNQLGESKANVLQLGRFGSAPVSLVWDNEDFPRCFIAIRPNARSTLLHLSLGAEDIQMFGEALDQIVKDIPQFGEESNGDG